MVPAFLAGPAVKSGLQIAKWAVPLAIAIGATIYILILQGELRHVRKVRDGLVTWQANTVATVAAEVPADRRKSVTPSTAAAEIQWLGREYRTHAEALRIQSERLVIAAGKATAAQNAATEARKRAVQRNSARKGTQDALEAEGRSTGVTEFEWEQL
jgi:hypothetical protein